MPVKGRDGSTLRILPFSVGRCIPISEEELDGVRMPDMESVIEAEWEEGSTYGMSCNGR
jgi:hypothetical protein